MAGRPTDYSQEKVEEARAYLTDYENQGDIFPNIAGLAIHLGVSRETVRRWAKDPEKEEFCGIVERCLAKQEQKLTAGGVRGDYNPTITKLLLTKHGYTDRQALEGPDGEPLPAPVTRIEIVAPNDDSED